MEIMAGISYRIINRLLAILLLSGFWLSSLQAGIGKPVDGVTVREGKVFAIQDDNLGALAENLKFPSDVEVTTNGTFTVGGGKERKLAEREVIRQDGWLVKPDGSIQPVFDHVAMKEGRVQIVRDGQAEALNGTMVFTNRFSFGPDGTCNYPDGKPTRLVDGQLFRLDGTPIAAKDAATLISGRVVVQKGGTLFSLQPVQIMGMNDGSRVFGGGYIEKRDGTAIHLREGQTILIEGVVVSR